MRKKAKAKEKAKATTRRKPTRDLGATKAGTVKGGIAPSVPRAPAVKAEWWLQ